MTKTPETETSQQVINLSGQLLVAMPGVVSGSLENTVIYLCEHSSNGALGLVINRPTDLTIADLLQRLNLDPAQTIGSLADAPVCYGGPVQTDRGFVLHVPGFTYSSSTTLGDFSLTTSRDVLQDIAQGKGPEQVLITLGYAGWGAGQLEEEMGDNAWLNVQATHDILFNVPHAQRYNAALAQLGIDPLMLSGGAGHA